MATVMEEIRILIQLDHPNIVKYYETYEDEKQVYLVMEYLAKGDLESKLKDMPHSVLQENVAKIYMRKILGAVKEMHAKKVIHRDIKPENIMLAADGEVKLIDFGLSRQCHGVQKTKGFAGTIMYMAPEVLNNTFDSSCDMWALGVMLYQFITGEMPFSGKNKKEIFTKIKEGKYDENNPRLKNSSEHLQNLIKQLLVVDKSKRIKAKKALSHAWFEDSTYPQID